MKPLPRSSFPKTISVLKQYAGLNVAVPSDFVGMHMHRWPTGNPVSADPGDLAYGHIRTHDNGSYPVGVTWRSINTAQGVYDWSGLDALISAHEARGASIIYTVYGTPAWAATATGQTHQDAYGQFGGADKPAQIAHLSTFITALVTRYGARIKYIEIWNEPGFTQDWSGFFWGSAIDLVAMGNAIYTAAKAVNPGVIILSPGFSGNGNVSAFLNAQDPVSGKYGYQVFDHFAFHPYGHTYLGQLFGADIELGGSQSIITTRALLDANSCSGKEMYITEWGVSGWLEPVLLTQADASFRRKLISRTLATAAILKVKGFSVYSYDHTNKLAGDYVNDIDGVRAGLKDVAVNLAGKTILSAIIYNDGSIKITTNVGDVVF